MENGTNRKLMETGRCPETGTGFRNNKLAARLEAAWRAGSPVARCDTGTMLASVACRYIVDRWSRFEQTPATYSPDSHGCALREIVTSGHLLCSMSRALPVSYAVSIAV
ncbi:uncharacterized protein LOC117282949 isoform X2 [Cryptotermes secundus]|uniref:uncharacterized protein LOC117282949 isoform X2 n=1 Tax=Cryptotermes secundus TaxID=105785 RepID=UPI001454BAF7|nr:uncharacterized protein LOC117282949 isoform X2 [Cryptotermes secundus]